MNTFYACPYCGQYQSSKTLISFSSWRAVATHTITCKNNDHTFTIHSVKGPVRKRLKTRWDKESVITAIQTFYSTEGRIPNKREFTVTQYPSHETVRRIFGSWNKGIVAAGLPIDEWDKESIILSIKLFFAENNRIPIAKEFKGYKYPSNSTVIRHFSSWNTAIEAAGFIPNMPYSFGNITQGLDGHMYRSGAEAYFCDNFLFNKHTYIIEPKYPKPYTRIYDWYVQDLDLYIELTGGLYPDVIEEKIKINKALSRNLIVIHTKDLYRKNFRFIE